MGTIKKNSCFKINIQNVKYKRTDALSLSEEPIPFLVSIEMVYAKGIASPDGHGNFACEMQY